MKQPKRIKRVKKEDDYEYEDDIEFNQGPDGEELRGGGNFTVAIVGDKEDLKVQSLTWAFTRSLVKILHVDDKEMSLEDLVKDQTAHVVFFCNPITQDENGVYHATELEDAVLRVLAQMEAGICVKTTMPIELVDRLCSRNTRIVYHPDVIPEFEGNLEEAMDPRIFVLGGHPQSTMALQEIYFRFSNYRTSQMSHVTPVEAAFVEAGIAGVCAAKATVFNQLYDVLQEYGGDYHLVSTYVGSDPRIGSWGARIPNPDLSRGFRQSRMVEAVKQLANFSERFTIFKEVDRMNDTYRNRGNESDEHNGQAEEEQQAGTDVSTS